MKLFVIQPIGGLCNRLRFLFSYIKKLKDDKKYGKITVYVLWEADNHCNGIYTDYFKCIKNINFTNKNDFLKIDIISGSILPEYKHINFLSNNLLYLKGFMYHRIVNIIHKLENKYIAIHVRRTDFDNRLNDKKLEKRTSDQDFIRFLNKYKNHNIYIATDNLETQKLFLEKFEKRIKYIKLINNNSDSLRKTSLEQAIIDLFVCACSNVFKGTYYSSFTSFICFLRNNIVEFGNPLESIRIFK